MQALLRRPGIPLYGLLYSAVLLLLAIPVALLYISFFGYGSSGLKVRLTKPATRVNDRKDDCVFVSVHRLAGRTPIGEPELHINSASVSWIDLRRSLKTELSRRGNRTVFVEGDGSLEVTDIVRVIDIARGARPGIPVVLLTPALKKTLGDVCVDMSPDRVLTPR